MENYRAINDNVAAIVTRAATVEEVCFEVTRDTLRDCCQCLRTSVDYLIFLITSQVRKFLDVTSATPTLSRKYFPTVAAIVVSSTENNVRDS